MRGGMRYGAGRRGWKVKVDSLLNLDVRLWASRKLLTPGSSFTSTWSRDGKKTSAIGVCVTSSNELKLAYDWMPDGEKSRQGIVEPVSLEYTPCHYGGSRVWFRCPHCSRRAAKLYLMNGRWRCRKSINGVYASQSQTFYDRLCDQAFKISERLGHDGDVIYGFFGIKPKGMHQKTYQRMVEKMQRARNMGMAGAATRLGFMF